MSAPISEIIRETNNITEFKRAVGDEECAAAYLPRPMDQKKQNAVAATTQRIERLMQGNRTTGDKPRSSVQIELEISEQGIPKIKDPDNILDDVIRDELELMGEIYYERTGIPEITVAIYLDFKTQAHDDHNYPIINVVWDKVDTKTSKEIGTTYINTNGQEAAPLNAFFWMEAYGYHQGKRLTDNGVTFIIRPTNEKVASMPDLHTGYGT